jgi:hypothetical protein
MQGDFLTIGKLCEILQLSPTRVQKLVEDAGASPKFTINGIAHFDEGVIDQLRTHLPGGAFVRPIGPRGIGRSMRGIIG